MTQDAPEWIYGGEGAAPRVGWTFATEAPLVALQLARETGEVLVADEAGSLYLLNRRGKLSGVSRGPSPIRAIVWGDTGSGGVALVGENTLYWFDRELKFDKKIELSDCVVNLSMDAHGQYVLANLESGANLVFDSPRKPIHRFDTLQTLIHASFLVREPAIIAVSAHGMLYKFDFRGNEEWNDNLLTGVGGLAVSGNGKSILLACFAQGIQRYSGKGTSVGSYQLGETVSRIAASYGPYRMLVATVESHIYWLDFNGRMLWAAQTPEEAIAVACDPLGYGAICGFGAGQLVRLNWK